MNDKLIPCLVEWADIKADCYYDEDDDNGGLIYGIHWEDDEGQIVEAEWFATVEERHARQIETLYAC